MAFAKEGERAAFGSRESPSYIGDGTSAAIIDEVV
jgi:hypothetical protein